MPFFFSTLEKQTIASPLSLRFRIQICSPSGGVSPGLLPRRSSSDLVKASLVTGASWTITPVLPSPLMVPTENKSCAKSSLLSLPFEILDKFPSRTSGKISS